MQDPWKLQKCFNFTDGETEITKVMLLLQPLDMFNYTWVKHVDVYTHTHTHMYVYVCLLDCPHFIWILCDILYVYLFIFIYLMQFSFLLILKIRFFCVGHNVHTSVHTHKHTHTHTEPEDKCDQWMNQSCLSISH